VFWTTNILLNSHADLPMYGYSGSPLVVDDKVIVAPGGRGGASVVAYDRLTSKVLWQSLNDEAAYSSPVLVTLAGRRQILAVTATRAVGLRVEDGELLWDFPWVVKMDNRNIAQPVLVDTNRVFLSAGYTTGCAVIEIHPEGGKFAARPVWQNKNLKNKFSSSVFWQGHLYGLDEDILTCVNAKSGERKWKDGRYGYGQLLFAGGYLVILSGTGEVALVRADPERYTEWTRFPAITGKTWNHPAMAHGRLLVRNAVVMACFDLGGGQ
jgi:outer membrane protein assembly factor BamB